MVYFIVWLTTDKIINSPQKNCIDKECGKSESKGECGRLHLLPLYLSYSAYMYTIILPPWHLFLDPLKELQFFFSPPLLLSLPALPSPLFLALHSPRGHSLGGVQ